MSGNTQYDKDKQAKLEAMRVIKEKNNETTDNTTEKYQALTPKTFKEKWSNYWYHYKFHTIAVLFVAMIVSSLFWNVLFGEKFDVTLNIVSGASFVGSETIIKSALEDFIVDYDNNGKKAMKIITTQLAIDDNTEMTPEMMQMSRTKIIGNLSKQESFLYLLDQQCYDELVSINVKFKNLNEIAKSEKIDGNKYILKGTKLSGKIGLPSVNDNLFLCIIDFDKFDKKAQSKNKMNTYNNEKDFLIKMIEQN